MEEKQQDQELRLSRDLTRELQRDQPVAARGYRTKEKMVPGVIIAYPGLFSSHEFSVAANTVWRRYIDQLKETAVTPTMNKEECTPKLDPAL